MRTQKSLGLFCFLFKTIPISLLIINSFSHAGHTYISDWLSRMLQKYIACPGLCLDEAFPFQGGKKTDASDIAFQGDNYTSQVVKEKMIYK